VIRCRVTDPVANPTVPAPAMAGTGPILFYDGTCAFCARSVRFLLARDRRRRTLRFAPRAGEAGRALEARHPGLAEVSSLLWVESDGGREQVITHSTAALHAARYLGGVWGALGTLGLLVPRVIRDAVYAVIARNRHRFRGRGEVCVVFRPEEAARVIA
jgi:predicted DCC family thiol-disulfide oxidoreductase YuxK